MNKYKNNLIKFLNLFLTVFSGLALVYLIYRSEFHNDGSKLYYYWKAYLIFSFLFLFSIFIFFISLEKREKILIFFYSIILSFYIVEFFLVINSGYFTKHFFFDDRTRYEVYVDEKTKNEKTIISLNANFFKFDYDINFYPLSSISNYNTINCNENGYYSKYLSDRFGYNNKDVLWDLDNFSFVLIGDSYAHGACVNYPNTISDVINKITNRNIINLGLSGNGPLLQYANLKEFFNYKKATNTIFLYYEDNDLSELKNEFKHPILKKYFEEENFIQNIYQNQRATDKMIIEKFNIKLQEFQSNKEDGFMIPSFFKMQNIRKIVNKFLGKREDFNIIKYESNSLLLFDKVMKKVQELTKKNNSNLYFVYIPGYNRFTKNILANDVKHLNYDDVINSIKKNNISLIDFYSRMKEMNDPLSLYPFRGFGHFNEKGYKVLAEYILQKIY